MYQVIGTARSRAMRVFWMLEELGQEYEILEAGPQSEAIQKVNPSGKVPALIVDGKAIFDSVAIMQFLADKHGALTYPCGSLERAEQDSFTHFANDELDAVLWVATKHTFYYPEELRVPDIRASAEWDFARAMVNLETRLGDNEFVMGDQITVPDLLLSHCAGWALGAKFELPKGKVGDYFKRLRARPALKRALGKASENTSD
ncbi:MAG: glutathione S-transferase family protein [Rhodobacteraceae bacterium]|nr:glutathione S-transferase family protein [Paracoccaceae bacterium]